MVWVTSSNLELETLIGRVPSLSPLSSSPLNTLDCKDYYVLVFLARAIVVMLQQVFRLEFKLFCDYVLQDCPFLNMYDFVGF